MSKCAGGKISAPELEIPYRLKRTEKLEYVYNDTSKLAIYFRAS